VDNEDDSMGHSDRIDEIQMRNEGHTAGIKPGMTLEDDVESMLSE
jgi:hypothetical protein